jgi:hypothetical protein
MASKERSIESQQRQNDNMSVGGNTFSDVESTAGGDNNNRQPMRKNYVLIKIIRIDMEIK